MGDFKHATDCQLLADFFKFIAAYVKKPADLQNWRKDLDCRIDLMACDVAKDAAGMELITHLENITGVNWAASTNKTGAGEGVENGFDWVLETEEGLGCVAGAYFHEDKLVNWKHHAGVLGQVAVIGGCALLVASGPIGATAVAGYATVGRARHYADVAQSNSAGEAGGKVAWNAANTYSGGTLGVANSAANGDWGVSWDDF